ncbi:MAG TPA: RNA polymerase subunit sigma-24 [Myxococcales bacterium]|nr:RNA polymerase subunit sigma-24 [Myxococcales bacterium]
MSEQPADDPRPPREARWDGAAYQRLRQIAHGFFRGLPESQTLQATALVHEAYVKLAEHDLDGLTDHAHFVSLGARTMRQVLVDHFRRNGALKRGGDRTKVTLKDVPFATTTAPEDLLALDTAVDTLTQLNPRGATVVELKFFCGLTTEEIASQLGVSTASVEREWRRARAWLRTRLDADLA